MATTYSSGNFHSVADHADFTLPDGDWCWLTILRPTDVTGGKDIISNDAYGITPSFNVYQNNNDYGLKVNGLSDRNVETAAINTWTLLVAQRSGGNLSLRSVDMGSTTVANSGNTAISTAVDSSFSIRFGRRSDNGDNPFIGAMSDAMFIPGQTISDADMQAISTGTAIDSFAWYSSRVFWMINSTSSQFDQTGNHAITVNGTLSSIADPVDLVRFSSDADLTAAGLGGFSGVSGTLFNSELTSGGVGGFSFNATAKNLIEFNASGASDATINIAAINPSELTASGFGGFSADSDSRTISDLSSVGAGGFSAEIQSTAQAELSASGVGEFSANITITATSEMTASGAGSASFAITSVVLPVTITGSNLYIIPENYIDNTSSLTADSTASGFDIDNVAINLKSKIHRTTGTSDETITATWSTSKAISAVGLAFTNLINGSTVQIELYANTDDVSPAYDSGALDIDFNYDPPTGFSTIGSASFPYGGGNYFSSLFATVSAKKMVLTINSSGNPNGYIEISRVICGTAYTPTIGASYGAQINHIDNSNITMTDSGDTLLNRGIVKKSISLSLDMMNPVDKHGLSNVIKNRGIGSPVFMSLYENSDNPEERQSFMIYGRFDQTPTTAITNFDFYDSNFSITEV